MLEYVPHSAPPCRGLRIEIIVNCTGNIELISGRNEHSQAAPLRASVNRMELVFHATIDDSTPTIWVSWQRQGGVRVGSSATNGTSQKIMV